jgi:nucleoside-diphosphate-sugar epimerase
MGRRIRFANAPSPLLQKITEKKLERLHVAARPGDVRQTWADIFRSQEILGYSPSVSFEDGVLRTVRYLMDQTKQSEWAANGSL